MVHQENFAQCNDCGVSDCDCEAKTYLVCAELTVAVLIEVEAAEEQEARKKALEEIDNKNYEVQELVDDPTIEWAELKE
ncbi:hypothetical protein [Pseudoalteromonas sp. R3]|uniref:hypothetical protein n=1 Tax=Pseudoalteromonas sp. R3 TaxID=1709477 RepID=UPI0006B4492D|nr:hypothetical protein [Pseudoalteromonas sp. R3]AZZ98778.1 hypothetical protein ELR70_17730 [Pseudoalteromonas sp. R3]